MISTDQEFLLPVTAVRDRLFVLVSSVSFPFAHLTAMLILTMMMLIPTTWMMVGWMSFRRGFGGANTGKVEIVIRSGKLT